ncbi:MAG: nucleotide exchange factor GrpE [Planctomycetota bacterium]
MGKRKKDRREEERPEDERPGGSTRTDTASDEGAPVSELEAAIREREQFREQWERARADYHNLQNRLPRLVEDRSRAEIEPFLRELVTVLDYLDMAMASPTESTDAKNLAFGVDMVRRQLVEALARHGVEPIELAPGDAFDPAWHEAVESVRDDERPEGTVLAVAKKGFAWRGRALRHAQVKVAAGTADDRDEENGAAPEPEDSTTSAADTASIDDAPEERNE